MPKQTQGSNLQVHALRFASYFELREEVFSFLDHVLPAATTAMDIGGLTTAGCWNCGSTQQRCQGGYNKGKAKGSKDGGKGKPGKDGGGKKEKGKGFGKPKGKSYEGKGKKGRKGQDYKPLNAVTTDPWLGQLQSAYAKAALEAYHRERVPTTAVVPPTTAPPPPQASTSNPSGKRLVD